MAIIKECNRCGTNFKKNLYTSTNDDGKEMYMDVLSTSVGELHLCDACWSDFDKFIAHQHAVVFIDPEKTFCRDCSRRISESDTAITGMVRYCPIMSRVREDYEKMCKSILLKDNPKKF